MAKQNTKEIALETAEIGFCDDCVQGNPRQAVLYAYLAGIIDGEGTIRIDKTDYSQKRMRSPQYLAQICIGMNDKQVLDLLKETFGGGNVREERVPDRRSVWRWAATGRFRVPPILRMLLPYLKTKRRHAEIVIDFCENWVRPYVSRNGVDPQELQRREEAYLKVRKLNAVGAAATTERVGPEREKRQSELMGNHEREVEVLPRHLNVVSR